MSEPVKPTCPHKTGRAAQHCYLCYGLRMDEIKRLRAELADEKYLHELTKQARDNFRESSNRAHDRCIELAAEGERGVAETVEAIAKWLDKHTYDFHDGWFNCDDVVKAIRNGEWRDA